MKLDTGGGSTSFYESFSDLIFATMAIFVLLMLVFLIQVNQAGQSEAYAAAMSQTLEQRLEESQSLLDIEQRKARSLNGQLKEAQAKIDALEHQVATIEDAVRAQEIEIVIAVDATGSMGEGLTVLKSTIETIAKVLPQIAPEVRIGIVAYRQRPSEQREIIVYDSKRIAPWVGDTPSGSYLELKRFVDSLSPENGRAPVRVAVDRALDMFSSGAAVAGSQTFMLIGDVGPWESSLNDADLANISRSERNDANAIAKRVRNWSQASPRRSVVSIYQSVEGVDESSTREQSIRFFRDTARAAGETGHFSVDHGQMLGFLLEAALDGD